MQLAGKITLQNFGNWPINEAGGNALETQNRPNRNAPLQETQMADYSNIGLRADSASEQTDNWKSISDLARKLAEKQGGGK